MRQEVILEKEQEFVIPDNVWAIDAETNKLIIDKTVSASQAKKLILVPKVAGG